MTKQHKAEQISADMCQRAYEQNCHRSQDVDLSTQTTEQLKWQFVEKAREVCPQWQVRADQREVINDIFRWCLRLDGNLDPNKGLWLYGNIGTGKSTMLRIIRAFCRGVRTYYSEKYQLQMPYTFRIANAIDVCSSFSKGGYAGIDEFINGQCQAFDELGSESIPTGYYGTAENVFQYIFQRRYDVFQMKDLITHVSTNISPQDPYTGQNQIIDRYGERIWDRCREMFNFVPYMGATWRKK